ncbi:MAG: CoA transferase [Burkholderiales bacterium]|nr:CoA transferase [Burkholderiales bacterium]
MKRPLEGVRIIEVGHMLMGPYCGLLLADLGAEVIKIEPPGGDIARAISPHWVGPHNTYFASLNRNKRSAVLDLATREGQQALGALAREAHALVTNLRPSAIRKLGLTYESLARHNAKLVCVALTGYGLDGPHAGNPAYDYVIQALTGVMALTGEPDGPPAKTGYSAVDNAAGIMGAVGLLAKLVEGRGGQVDIAMFDVMLSQFNYLAAAWLNAGEPAARQPLSAHPYIVPAQIFRTADGWLTLFITHDDFWRSFATEAGRPEWIADPRFSTMAARRENRAAVLSAVSAVLLGDSTGRWVARLAPLGVVVSAVETLEQALASAQARARGMVVEIATPHGPIRAVGNPIKCSGAPERYEAPPEPGGGGRLAGTPA